MNQAIKIYLNAGLSVIPIRDYETKAPLLEWTPYRAIAASLEEASAWVPPIALIGGKVSGGLVCIDFDDAGSQWGEWVELVNASAPGLLERLVIQRTPSGGYHACYRTDAPPGNKKLASKQNNETLIETRGEGGYFLVYPSAGYMLLQGKFSRVQSITADEQNVLLSCASALNQKVKEPQQEQTTHTPGDTPNDDYDANVSPVDLLRSHGWEVAYTRGEKMYLRRPGKKHGISATWNAIPGRFYCFSTSTVFEPGIYKPSAVYAHLEHGGDYSAAAKTLYSKGYGRRIAPKVSQAGMVQTAAYRDSKNAPGVPRARIVTIDDLEQELIHYRIHGIDDNGVSTGWVEMDEYYRISKGQFTVVTGIPSYGKSEWMDAVIVNTSANHGWRWLVYSPENYPFVRHIRKFIEKWVGKSFDQMDEVPYLDGIKWLKEHIRFIDQSWDGTRLSDILTAAESMLDTWKPDAMIIDPWNEVAYEMEGTESETNYIGRQISRCRNFARHHDIAFFVVAHPTKLQKDKQTKTYAPPTPYDISGSSHWYNKVDNAITVHRNFDNETTEIYIRKVKFKQYGHPGMVSFKYHWDSGRFAFHAVDDVAEAMRNTPERDRIVGDLKPYYEDM